MLAELWISLDKEEIEVEIIRSKRRSMAIQIRTDGSVVVRVPMHASDRAIKRFVSAHARWIADNRGQMFERRKKLADNPYDTHGDRLRLYFYAKSKESLGEL